jgi:hypothetical protein
MSAPAEQDRTEAVMDAIPLTFTDASRYFAWKRQKREKNSKVGGLTDSQIEATSTWLLREEVKQSREARKIAAASQADRGIDDNLLKTLGSMSILQQLDADEMKGVPLLSRQASRVKGRKHSKKELQSMLDALRLVALEDTRVAGVVLHGLDDKWATVFADALREGNKTLVSMSCSLDSTITDKGVIAIVDAILGSPCSCLKSLNLAGNHVSNEGAAALSRLLQSDSRQLSFLNLAASKFSRARDSFAPPRIDAYGAEALGKGLAHPECKLVRLSLRGHPIQDKGSKAIAQALHSESALEELYLADCDVGDDAATSFGKALLQCSSSLRILDLSRNCIAAAGAASLAPALKCGVLQSLDVSYNHISREGCEIMIAAASMAPSMANLLIHGNALAATDESMRVLQQICTARRCALPDRRRWLTSRLGSTEQHVICPRAFLPVRGGYMSPHTDSYFNILALREPTPQYAAGVQTRGKSDFWSMALKICASAGPHTAGVQRAVERAQSAPVASVVAIQKDRDAIRCERRAHYSRDANYGIKKRMHLAAGGRLKAAQGARLKRTQALAGTSNPAFSKALPSLHKTGFQVMDTLQKTKLRQECYKRS